MIPFNEVVGNGAMSVPEQIGPTGAKVGVTLAPSIFTVAVVVDVHPLASFTVMVYGPAANPKNILLAWKVVPSLL